MTKAKTAVKRGGRPPKAVNRKRRSIQMCATKEWPKLWRYSTGTSYTDRVRDLIALASKTTKRQRATVMKRWQVIVSKDRKGTLSEPIEQTINMGEAEWKALAELIPLGSWADKLRQAIELARIAKAK